MKNLRRVGALVVLTGIMVMSLSSAAFAANDTSGNNTNWTIPTTAMTNTVEKDGITYKVITTWANAWASNGPDYLGVSNSCWMAGTGGSDFVATNLTNTQTASLGGIWASSANESPNAYAWNTFYNLYANSDEGIAAGAVAASFESTGSSYDSESGVYGPFKYRPEIMWCSNGMRTSAVATYVGYINNGEYQTTGDEAASTYYIAGDESYDPYIISAYCQNPYAYAQTLYGLAAMCEEVIEATASYTGTATDWKGMNSLPRTTRYDKSAAECALSYEKATRGSVYYVLSKIADGTVQKKKVAYLTSAPSTSSNTVTVAAYDYTENIGGGGNGGYASFSPLVVDQLITTTDVKDNRMTTTSTVGASADGTNSGADGSELWYTSSTATADDLLDCDIIYCPNGNTTASAIQEWLSSQATSTDKAEKIANIQVLAQSVSIVQWSNFTIEKVPYGVYAVNFFYPELFGNNLGLYAYYVDEVYHVTDESLTTVVSYLAGGADLPSGVELSALADTYSLEEMEAKFAAGYAYYAANYSTDATISRILSGTPLANTGSKDATLALNSFEPSETYAKWYYQYIYGSMVEDEEILELLVETSVAMDTAQAELVVAERNAAIDENTISDLNDTVDSLTSSVSSLKSEVATLTESLESATDSAASAATAYETIIEAINTNYERLAEEAAEAAEEAAEAAQTISAAKKSAKIKKGKTVKIKISGASTTIKASCAKAGVKVSVKNGKVVIKGAKKGTYTVKVYAAAGSGYAKSNVVKIKVTVK